MGSAFNTAEAEVGLKTANALPEVASYNAVAPVNVILDKKPGWLRSANLPGMSARELSILHIIKSQDTKKKERKEVYERKRS